MSNPLVKILGSIVIVLLVYGCSGSVYKRMSVENPEKLLSMQDSLLFSRKNDQNILEALVSSHNSVADKYMKQNEYLSAINHYENATRLDNSNTASKYGLLLAEGHALLKKGNKNGIWDAIEKYSKASKLYPGNGEPFYWIAIAYTKLGDKDFDLIFESYEKALSLELDNGLMVEAEKNYKQAKERKKKLDSFWR
jgi:tetratricopeptide (TPR) repeat protein